MNLGLDKLNRNVLFTVFSYLRLNELQSIIFIISKKFNKAWCEYIFMLDKIKLNYQKIASKRLTFNRLKKIELHMGEIKSTHYYDFSAPLLEKIIFIYNSIKISNIQDLLNTNFLSYPKLRIIVLKSHSVNLLNIETYDTMLHLKNNNQNLVKLKISDFSKNANIELIQNTTVIYPIKLDRNSIGNYHYRDIQDKNCIELCKQINSVFYRFAKLKKIYILNEISNHQTIEIICKALSKSVKTIVLENVSCTEKHEYLANLLINLPCIKSANGVYFNKRYIKLSSFRGKFSEALLQAKLKDLKYNVNLVKFKNNFSSVYMRPSDLLYEGLIVPSHYDDYKDSASIIINAISKYRQHSARDLSLVKIYKAIRNYYGHIELDLDGINLPHLFWDSIFTTAKSISLQNTILPIFPIKFSSQLNEIILQNINLNKELFITIINALQKIDNLHVIIIKSYSGVHSRELLALMEIISKLNFLTKVNLDIKTEINIENGQKIKSCLTEILTRNNLTLEEVVISFPFPADNENNKEEIVEILEEQRWHSISIKLVGIYFEGEIVYAKYFKN